MKHNLKELLYNIPPDEMENYIIKFIAELQRRNKKKTILYGLSGQGERPNIVLKGWIKIDEVVGENQK